MLNELERERCPPNERDEVQQVDDCASSDGLESASSSDGEGGGVHHVPLPPAHLLARDVRSCKMK